MKIKSIDAPQAHIKEVTAMLRKYEHLFPSWVSHIFLYQSKENPSCGVDFDYRTFRLYVPLAWGAYDKDEMTNVILHEIAHCYTTPQVEMLQEFVKAKGVPQEELDAVARPHLEHATESLAVLLEELTNNDARFQ